MVLDASVMIAALDSADIHSDAALRLLREAAPQRLAAPRLTIAEALIRPARTGEASVAAATLDAVGVGRFDDPHDPVRLAELRARTGLRLPDCVVLEAALRERADLATFDQRLAEVARHEGVSVVGA